MVPFLWAPFGPPSLGPSLGPFFWAPWGPGPRGGLPVAESSVGPCVGILFGRCFQYNASHIRKRSGKFCENRENRFLFVWGTHLWGGLGGLEGTRENHTSRMGPSFIDFRHGKCPKTCGLYGISHTHITYGFFIVFSWFFQRTGLQRTGNPSVFIVGHPSMNSLMDIHQ